MDKFPKIRYDTDELYSREVVVTEKVDGANFRFSPLEDGRIMFGSRKVVFSEGDDPLRTPDVNSDFRHAVDYVASQFPADRRSEFSDWTFYGEALQRHSLEYDGIEYGHEYDSGMPHPVDDTPNVILFDAKENGEWVDWDEFCEIVYELGFIHTPVLDRGDYESLNPEIPDESFLGGPPEGIVARTVGGYHRAKKVTDEFRETNATVFEDPSKAQSDAAEFVAAYVTRNRIENVAHSLSEAGEYESLQMEMMEDLPREVLRDTMAELGWDLLTSGGFEAEWNDEFKHDVRSRASKKCARTLRGMIGDL